MINLCCCGPGPCPPLFSDGCNRANETINDTPSTDSTGQLRCVGTATGGTPSGEAKWKILNNRLTIDVPSGLSTSLANRPRANHVVSGSKRALSFAADLWFPAAGAKLLLEIDLNISSTTVMLAWAEFACGADDECGTMRILVQDESGHSAATQIGATVPVPNLTWGVKHRARICLDFDLKLCTIACDDQWHHAADMPFNDTFSGLTAACACTIYPDQGHAGLYKFDNVEIRELTSHGYGYGYGYGDNGCPCCRPSGCESVTDKFDGIEVQRVRITGSPTGGTYTLGWNDGVTDYDTGPIDFNADGEAVEAALHTIPGLENVTVTTTGDSPNFLHQITFAGVIDPLELTLVSNDLTGGSSPDVTITTYKAYGTLGCMWDGGETVTADPEAEGLDGFVTLDADGLTWNGSWSGLDSDCLVDGTTQVATVVKFHDYGASLTIDIGDVSATLTIESAEGAGDGTLALSTGDSVAISGTIEETIGFCVGRYDGAVVASSGGHDVEGAADTATDIPITVTSSAVALLSKFTVSHHLLDGTCAQCVTGTTPCELCPDGVAPLYSVVVIEGLSCPSNPALELLNGSHLLTAGGSPPGSCCWTTEGGPFVPPQIVACLTADGRTTVTLNINCISPAGGGIAFYETDIGGGECGIFGSPSFVSTDCGDCDFSAATIRCFSVL